MVYWEVVGIFESFSKPHIGKGGEEILLVEMYIPRGWFDNSKMILPFVLVIIQICPREIILKVQFELCIKVFITLSVKAKV